MSTTTSTADIQAAVLADLEGSGGASAQPAKAEPTTAQETSPTAAVAAPAEAVAAPAEQAATPAPKFDYSSVTKQLEEENVAPETLDQALREIVALKRPDDPAYRQKFAAHVFNSEEGVGIRRQYLQSLVDNPELRSKLKLLISQREDGAEAETEEPFADPTANRLVRSLQAQVAALEAKLDQFGSVAEEAKRTLDAEGTTRAQSQELQAFFKQYPQAVKHQQRIVDEVVDAIQESPDRYRGRGTVSAKARKVFNLMQDLLKDSAPPAVPPKVETLTAKPAPKPNGSISLDDLASEFVAQETERHAARG